MTSENKQIDHLKILAEYETQTPYDLLQLIDIMTDIVSKYDNFDLAKKVVRILANKNTKYYQSLGKSDSPFSDR